MTRATGTKAPLAWDHAVRDVPDQGLSVVREATADELAATAQALDLVACTSLRGEYRVAPTLGARFHLSGRFRAQVTQTCVVTLEPVESTIEEAFEAVFWPPEAMPTPASGEVPLDDEPEREPIEAGHIAVGRVLFESLAAALDPFPRKPGAVLDWQPPAAADPAAPEPANPFAVLANLKPKG